MWGKKKHRGFTLIELLVVIAIVGILAGIVLAGLASARNKAKIAQAESELHQLDIAVQKLYIDTGRFPNGATSACQNGNEVQLDICDAGIQCMTPGNFNVGNDGVATNLNGWSGPYMTVPKDPWGSTYMMDGDYQCYAATDGCQGVDDGSVISSVLVSCGPNKSCAYDTDNIVVVLCKR